MAVRECSLHFDFMNEQKQLDLDKARELFGIAQKLGIHTYNTYGNAAVYPDPADDEKDHQFAREIRQLADQFQMSCSSFHFIGSVLDVEQPDQQRIRHVMQRSLQINSQLGTHVFVAHPGTFSDGGFKQNKVVHRQALQQWGAEKTHQIIVENLRWFGQQAAHYGIRLAIENIYGGRFYSQIDELIQLVEEVDLDNVGWCLDVGHANVDGVDLVQTVHRMKEKLFELHLHDNNGQKDQHLPAGFGTVDWIAFIQALNDIQYPGPATFEFFRWPLADREKGITRAVELWRTMEWVAENGYWTLDWF